MASAPSALGVLDAPCEESDREFWVRNVKNAQKSSARVRSQWVESQLQAKSSEAAGLQQQLDALQERMSEVQSQLHDTQEALSDREHELK